MTITLRETTQAGATNKGDTLTRAELDGNFVDLLTNKIIPIQIDADSGSVKVGQAQNNGVMTVTGGTNITTAVTEDSAGNANLTITGTTFMANLTDDSTPQLSGNLDTNNQNIVTTSNRNLKLYPNGSGVVEIGGDGSDDGTIQLNCSQNSHGIKLASPPHSAGQSYTLTFPSTSPNANDFISTDGSGNLKFTKLTAGTGITITNPDSAGDFVITNTVSAGISDVVSDSSPQLGGNLDVNGNSIVSTSNADINITPDNNGKVVIDGINYPQADGNAGEYLVTDGSNNLSFQPLAIVGGTDITVTQPDSSGAFTIAFSGSSGIASMVNDSTPQLGGNLDVNGNDIVSTSNGNIDIQPNGTGKTNIKNMTYDENIHDITYGANITPEPTDGPIQRITLTGNVNFNGFATEIEGATITLVITQDSAGNRTFTENLDSAGRMLFAGGTSTLSTAANAIDIMTITFIGGTYFASLSTNFS